MSKSQNPAQHAWFVGRASDFIAAVAQDQTLRTWLLSMQDKSDDERTVQVARVARRMRDAGEDEPLVRVIESMRHRQIYEGILRTLRDVT
jgi:DNA-binding PucR family transcriptional regulator